MKKIIFYFLLLFPFLLSAQEDNKPVILNFNSVLIKNIKNPDPKDQIEDMKTTVLIGRDENSETKLYFPDGTFNLFKRASSTEQGKLDTGISYQIFKALDEIGNEVLILLYSNKIVKFLFLDTNFKPDVSITLYP